MMRSPILSISEVTVQGAVESDPASVIDALGMGVGTPTMDVDSGAITRGVEEDPWVADARVSVTWPGAIAIDVVEHQPIAVVRTGAGWSSIAPSGALVEAVSSPGGDDAVVDIDAAPASVGDSSTDEEIVGAVAFIEALSPERRAGTMVAVANGGLVAEVDGHPVRLGRPVDMDDKAVVLESLLDTGLEPGASIDVIAPSRPAVTNPQPQVEPEE